MARHSELELAKAFQVDLRSCRGDMGGSFQGSIVGSKHPLSLFWLCWSAAIGTMFCLVFLSYYTALSSVESVSESSSFSLKKKKTPGKKLGKII